MFWSCAPASAQRRRKQRELDALERLLSQSPVHSPAVPIGSQGWAGCLRLQLTDIPLMESGGSTLGKSLGLLPSLVELRVHACKLRVAGATALAAGIHDNGLPAALATFSLQDGWDEGGPACCGRLCEALVAAGATSLTAFDLSSNGHLPAGGIAIARMIEALRPPLRLLDVSDGRFGGGGARALSEVHHSSGCLSALSSLNLFAGHIGPMGGVGIGRLLASPAPPPLTHLNLSENAIQDLGLLAIANAMKQQPAMAARLEELDLASNGLGLGVNDDMTVIPSTDDASRLGPKLACAALADAFAATRADGGGHGGCSLRRLDLSENFLDDGLVVIVDALTVSRPPLQWLDLSCTCATAEVARSLTRFFEARAGGALLLLGLYFNPQVGDEAMAGLLRAIRGGESRLQQLHVGQCGMGEAALSEALALLEVMVRAPSEPPARASGGHAAPTFMLDLRGNEALSAPQAEGFAAVRQRLGSALDLHLPNDPWPATEYCLDDGWHRSGLPEKRAMWSECSETVIFLEGDDSGAELYQPAVVIQEPGGELNRAV